MLLLKWVQQKHSIPSTTRQRARMWLCLPSYIRTIRVTQRGPASICLVLSRSGNRMGTDSPDKCKPCWKRVSSEPGWLTRRLWEFNLIESVIHSYCSCQRRDNQLALFQGWHLLLYVRAPMFVLEFICPYWKIITLYLYNFVNICEENKNQNYPAFSIKCDSKYG